MSKWIFPGVVLLLAALAVIIFVRRPDATLKITDTASPTQPPTAAAPVAAPVVLPPLDRTSERVTKKTFGTKVSPQSSPVMPEKFSGYHTGWDFEVFADEISKDVPIVAFCAGKLRSKQTVNGYGGVVIQDCEIDGVVMTALYGHLNLASVTNKSGDDLTLGQKIGLLGADKSTQTDGERKHLHFSLHKGSSINLRGYVDTQAELAGWLDPKEYLK